MSPLEIDGKLFHVVSEPELKELVDSEQLAKDVLNIALWGSLGSFAERDQKTGIWDPAVQQALDAPASYGEPPEVFLVGPGPDNVRLMPHLGATGIQTLLASNS